MILKRIDKMEVHLDEMRGAIVQMTRTEERVATVIEQNTILFSKLEKLESRVLEKNKEIDEQLKAIEISDARHIQAMSFIERGGWLIASAIFAFLSGLAVWFLK